MSVLDLASVSRSSAGYTTLAALPAFPEYVDSDGYTRALAERESDGAIVVAYVRGSHHDLVGAFNERSRINHERSAAAKRAADETLTEDERAMAARAVEGYAEALATLVRVRSTPTLHIARALTHYERATDEAAAGDPVAAEQEDSETDTE